MTKITKTKIQEFVKTKLRTSDKWALRALVVVYANQTADEQAVGATHNLNGEGFSGADAEFLSSLAVQYAQRNSLSSKQIEWLKKKISRYSRQVMDAANRFELVAQYVKG